MPTHSTPAMADTPAPDNSPRHQSPLLHSSFYRFVRVPDPEATVQRLRELSREVLGLILVASEGINGAVAGSPEALRGFEESLQHDPLLEGLFTGIPFKRSACNTAPFHRMKVHHKAEILPLGVPGVNAVGQTGIDVSPQEWHELIHAEDVILIDNRNSFEYRLGRFKNAIDPQVHNFRDFPRYIEENVPHWKASGKRVAMYCTGGIRCEKTTAWMKSMDMEVYQLAGGILNYFEQMPDATDDWTGECFVFDNRIALNPQLEETPTTAEEVYSSIPDEQWRLERAQRLAAQGKAQERRENTSSYDGDHCLR